MREAMSPRERVRAVLRGQAPDRPPMGLWRHFYGLERTAQGMAVAMLAFQHRYHWDFLKVNPRASYHAEGWGLQLQYPEDPFQPPKAVGWPVRSPQDWLALSPLNPLTGVLGEHLEALSAISQGLKRAIPFVMTVFSPLSIASRLVSSEEVLLHHLQEAPEKVQYALEVITQTFTAFAWECIARGADGLFFATTSWASASRLTPGEYERWGRPYDLRVLRAVAEAPFNILHICRDHIFFDLLADYPVACINWDISAEGNPSLREGWERLHAKGVKKAVLGGVRHQTTLLTGTPQQVAHEVRALLQEMGPRPFLLGGGCTYDPQAPEANIQAVREAVALA